MMTQGIHGSHFSVTLNCVSLPPEEFELKQNGHVSNVV